MDKQSNLCLVFDACINSRPYKKCLDNHDFKLFITELAIEWVEEKHKLKLNRGQITFPKMMAKGNLIPHTIARQKRPIIDEVEQVPVIASTAVPTESIAPDYLIVCEPEEDPKYLAIQLSLPLIVFAIYIGEHRCKYIRY